MAVSLKSKVFPVPFCWHLLMPFVVIILIGDSIKCEEEPYVDIDKYWGTVTIPAGKSGELLSHVKHLYCNMAFYFEKKLHSIILHLQSIFRIRTRRIYLRRNKCSEKWRICMDHRRRQTNK